MTDLEFLNAAEAALRKIETTCDRINDQTDADIDTQRNGGVLTLAFANGSQIVVNLQKPLQEIWLAAKAGGFHYRFNGTHWMDTKGDGELFAHLNHYASAQAGVEIVF